MASPRGWLPPQALPRPILDLRKLTGGCSGREIRWANRAASAIRRMLDLEADPEGSDPDSAARDRSIESLKKAVRSSLDSLDWEKLRRMARKQ